MILSVFYALYDYSEHGYEIFEPVVQVMFCKFGYDNKVMDGR